MPGRRPAHAPGGQLRIIGGQWRSRRLTVPSLPGLRPTPDRVRETLFNWLAPHLEGAWCLDLFAGTGVLGLEALSRGAAGAVLVDREPAAVVALQGHTQRLQAAGAEVLLSDALSFLARPPPRSFDVVFLDPPYQAGLLPACLDALQRGWLQPQARVYIESAADDRPTLPAGLCWLKTGRTGQVGYHLAGLIANG
jgi:16S rRNA (guanine966-N2)-methyltransferase